MVLGKLQLVGLRQRTPLKELAAIEAALLSFLLLDSKRLLGIVW